MNKINEIINFINEEITERRDYSASKMCEVIKDKIEVVFKEKENNFKITVFKDDEMDGFGAYASTSIKRKDGAIVLLNVDANLVTGLEHNISFKEMVVETLMHEVGHALEEWFDLDFDEERIDRITESYREKYMSSENE